MSNGDYGFDLTSSPFWKDPKGTKRSSPLRTAFAALRFPRAGFVPWARRHGPSMAHRGSPGIHAGRPTPHNLLSASREGWQIKSSAPLGGLPAGLFCRPYVPVYKIYFSFSFSFVFAFAFAFAVAPRLSRQRECPSQKAERRCCYGGGADGRRASRDGPWMARRGVPP